MADWSTVPKMNAAIKTFIDAVDEGPFTNAGRLNIYQTARQPMYADAERLHGKLEATKAVLPIQWRISELKGKL